MRSATESGVSVPDVLLARPYAGATEYMTHLREEIERSTVTRDANIIHPRTSRIHPTLACRLRLSILLRTYNNEYFTDAYDIRRLAKKVEDCKEMIWFWGDAPSIATVKHWIAVQHAPSDAEISATRLGTISVIDVSHEFGPGHGELCRAGSVQATVGAKVPAMIRTLDFMSGDDELMCPRYHSMILMPRNRRSTRGVRGGEAIHRIHSHYVRSRFWGFNPWYVMQENSLEMLDYREDNRDPEDVRRAILNGSSWYFAHSDEAAYAEAICEMNFGVSPKIVVLGARASASAGGRFRVICSDSEEVRRFNHGMLLADPDGAGLPLVHAIDVLDAQDVCAQVVRLRLDEEKSPGLQSLLLSRGFVLGSVLPSKHTWLYDQEHRIALPPYGFWVRRSSRWRVEPPYFADEGSSYAPEALVLRYMKERIGGG